MTALVVSKSAKMCQLQLRGDRPRPTSTTPWGRASTSHWVLDPALIAPCKVDVAVSAGASWFRNVWKSPLVSVWKPPVRYRDV